ncbi:hypothetical protein K5X82_06250 [Halosquirtibacter xylanolyticus]|uniref:SWIM zinc finger family protein n=1 Tax=Halosquirtibacter xylanolyticus TaxID=3374599 RepID=UPI003749C9E4|nr:hypothetical protein K5X82_06250 [Prolixibacteraceae bacterium]
MTIEDFIESATPYAADRGQWYYESGALHDFVKHNDHQYSAKVKALTNDFTVELKLDQNSHISTYKCNCCDQHIACKHLVALAFRVAYDPDFDKTEDSKLNTEFLDDLRNCCEQYMAQLKEKGETPTSMYNPRYNSHKESSKFDIE